MCNTHLLQVKWKTNLNCSLDSILVHSYWKLPHCSCCDVDIRLVSCHFEFSLHDIRHVSINRHLTFLDTCTKNMCTVDTVLVQGISSTADTFKTTRRINAVHWKFTVMQEVFTFIDVYIYKIEIYIMLACVVWVQNYRCTPLIRVGQGVDFQSLLWTYQHKSQHLNWKYTHQDMQNILYHSCTVEWDIFLYLLAAVITVHNIITGIATSYHTVVHFHILPVTHLSWCF